MRTLHFLGASLFVAMLSFGVASCGDEDSNIDAPIDLPVVDQLDKAIIAKPITTIAASDNSKYAATLQLSNAPLSKIILLDNGVMYAYPVEAAQAKTRAVSENVLTGTYKVQNGMIIANIEGYTIEIPVSKMTEVIINSTPYTSTVVEGNTEPSTVSLCRTWYPAKYDVVIYSGSKAFKTYSGSTVLDIQNQISKGADTEVDLLQGEVSQVSFLNDNTIVTTYNGKESEIADWKWTDMSKGEFKATFGKKVNYRDLNCYVRFEKGNPNTAYLVIDFKVELKDINNQTFTADAMTIVTLKDAK